YNRAVNNINVTVVHNVYERNVNVNNNVRVSFHGGPNGIRLRPRPAELVALREPHAPPMQVQVQHQQAASVDRAQFAAVNHGRPANLVVAKALVANRDVHPVVAPRPQNLPVVRPRSPEEVHPGATQPARAGEPMRPEAAPAVHPAARPGERPAPSPAVHPTPRPEERPAAPPAAHPAPRQETRPAPPPAAHPVERPAPAPAVHPAPRPQERPAAPPATHPTAPAAHPAAPPAAHPAPRPQERPAPEAKAQTGQPKKPEQKRPE
ncbi:MAG: hypothetical protein ABSD67_25920, partial [Terracidiphilus sp.]